MKLVESARQAAKPAIAKRQTGNSVPPASITSASPSATRREASPMACAPGRAGRDHGVVRTFQPMLDRDIARREIDQASGDEERAHPARPLLGEEQRGLLDSLQAADAGADQHAGADLILIGGGLPARVLERLRGSAHGVDDEVVDLALLLRLHPIVRIEGAVAAVAARHLAGDLAGRDPRRRNSRCGAPRSRPRAAAPTRSRGRSRAAKRDPSL